MMRMVGTFEAKTRLIELLRDVAGGETVTITKRGKPVAIIAPVPSERKQDRRAAMEELRRLRESLPRVSAEELAAWVQEGRR
jgi:prevent-host-death family protein